MDRTGTVSRFSDIAVCKAVGEKNDSVYQRGKPFRLEPAQRLLVEAEACIVVVFVLAWYVIWQFCVVFICVGFNSMSVSPVFYMIGLYLNHKKYHAEIVCSDSNKLPGVHLLLLFF